MRKIIAAALAASLLVLTSIAASAAITFDAETGTGFVGKGDVQYTFGWNNKQLQDNASNVRVRINIEETSEVTWECTNENNGRIQERERTTTTTITGLVTTVGRLKNQITGFNLNGFAAGGSSTTTTTDGPQLNSCPNANGTWSLTSPAGEPVITGTSGSGFEVSIDGVSWRPLLEAPAPTA